MNNIAGLKRSVLETVPQKVCILRFTVQGNMLENDFIGYVQTSWPFLSSSNRFAQPHRSIRMPAWLFGMATKKEIRVKSFAGPFCSQSS